LFRENGFANGVKPIIQTAADIAAGDAIEAELGKR
jgi:hypothetical protein